MVQKKSLSPLRSPKISVILPTYNTSKYIQSAIDSILSQSFEDFELIIIDDASSDNTWEIIKKNARKDKRIKPLRNLKNQKLSKTLNLGIDASRGIYIARMDADDWSYPDRLEKQYKFMEENKKIGIVGGSMEIIKENGKIIGKRKYPLSDSEIRKKIFWFSPFSHPLVMIRKSVLERVGVYNPDFNPAEDYELYFRIGKISKFANLYDTLLKYRVIQKSMTTGTTKKMELKTIEIRNLYKNSKKYKMTFFQKIYNSIHLISTYILPSRLKIWIFNTVRNSKEYEK